MFIRRVSVLALSSALLALGASAHALTATQKVEKEIIVRQSDGTEITRLVSAEEVTPGEKVVYTVDFVNDSPEPASDLILAMPVPSDIRFLEGTADREGAVVKYSVDGGRSFAERALLTLPAVGGGTRPATPDDITHIQWRISGPVLVGAQDAVTFKGRLK